MRRGEACVVGSRNPKGSPSVTAQPGYHQGGEFRATLRQPPSKLVPGGKGDPFLGSLSVTHSEGVAGAPIGVCETDDDEEAP